MQLILPYRTPYQTKSQDTKVLCSLTLQMSWFCDFPQRACEATQSLHPKYRLKWSKWIHHRTFLHSVSNSHNPPWVCWHPFAVHSTFQKLVLTQSTHNTNHMRYLLTCIVHSNILCACSFVLAWHFTPRFQSELAVFLYFHCIGCSF